MIDLYKLGFGVGIGNRFVMGEKSKKEGVFKNTPRDITGNILCMLIINYDNGMKSYEYDLNEDEYFKIDVNVELVKREEK